MSPRWRAAVAAGFRLLPRTSSTTRERLRFALSAPQRRGSAERSMEPGGFREPARRCGKTHLAAPRPCTQCDRLAPGRAVPRLTMRFPVTEYVASLAMVRVRRLLPSPLVIAPLLHSALSAHGNATAWRFPRRTHLAAPRPGTQCATLRQGAPSPGLRCVVQPLTMSRRSRWFVSAAGSRRLTERPSFRRDVRVQADGSAPAVSGTIHLSNVSADLTK